MTAQLLLWGALAVAALAAGWDVATRRIPNWSVLLLAGLALAHSLAVGAWDDAGSAAIHAALALVAGLLLFRFGVIGGGDAKLYTAAALGVPLAGAIPMLGYLAAAALIIFLALFVFYRGFKIRNSEGKRVSWTLPYAVPIAAAFLAVKLPLLLE